MTRLTLQPAEVRVRHIREGTFAEAGAVSVLGVPYVPQDEAGISGPRGWVSGSYSEKQREPGEFTLTFPNAAGGTGGLHRDRFLVITKGEDYEPGDEWFEVYRGVNDLLFVGTPVAARLGPDRIELRGTDSFDLLKTQRVTTTFAMTAAPRDALEHFTGVIAADYAESFDDPIEHGIVYGTAQQASERWVSLRADPNSPPPGRVRLTPVAGDGAGAYIRGGKGDKTTTQRSHWRIEATVWVPVVPTAPSTLAVGLGAADAANDIVAHVHYPGTGANATIECHMPACSNVAGSFTLTGSGRLHVAVEVHEKTAYYFVDGRLAGIQPVPDGAAIVGRPVVRVTLGAGAAAWPVDVDDILVREWRPWLLRGAKKGDLHLPGLTAPGTALSGGLVGTYWSTVDASATGLGARWRAAPGFDPRREPEVRRVDPQPRLNNAVVADQAAVHLGGATATNFMARWTGAIHLDLAAGDVALRVYADDRTRVWVGRTRPGEELINSWNDAVGESYRVGPALRSHLGVTKTGWYPIIADYGQVAGSYNFRLERSVAGGPWQEVPSIALSPYGIYSADLRQDSHFEQVTAVVEAFGHQLRCEPRSLESGEFPGQLVPRIRMGRDRDIALSLGNATEMTNEIDASGVIRALLSDAQGVGDPENAATVTAERVHFPGLEGRPMVRSEYQSIGDISEPALLQQRLRSVLELRRRPWQETSARPQSNREIVPIHQLPEELDEFRWAVGDGVIQAEPRLAVRDLQHRQIEALTRSFTQQGLSLPQVAFRQRPRSSRADLRRLYRQVNVAARSYTPQLVTSSSGVKASPAQSYAPDDTARLPVPVASDALVSLRLVVLAVSGGTAPARTVHVNGVSTGIVVTGPRTVPLEVARDGLLPRIRVSLADPGATGGIFEFAAELTFRI